MKLIQVAEVKDSFRLSRNNRINVNLQWNVSSLHNDKNDMWLAKLCIKIKGGEIKISVHNVDILIGIKLGFITTYCLKKKNSKDGFSA